MKLTTVTTTGTKGSLTANDALFAAEVNPVLLSQAIRVYLSNQRQGTSKVKTRAEIARTKAKWFKQKGTGNARHGARTPNIFVGGGVSHGPNGEQNWQRSLPVRMKRQALIQALSAQAGQVVIANDLTQLSGKTAKAAELVAQAAQADDRVLVIMPAYNETALRALRNIEQVLVTTAERVTALEVSLANVIMMPADSLKVLEQRLLNTDTEDESGEHYDPSAAQLVGASPVVSSRKAATKKVSSKKAPEKTAEKSTKTTKAKVAPKKVASDSKKSPAAKKTTKKATK
jgi:large subunit ribosomal protein L4